MFNFPPAKLHMGDYGSTALGLSVAFLSLDFYSSNPSAKFGSHFPNSRGLTLPPCSIWCLPLLPKAARARFAVFRGTGGIFTICFWRADGPRRVWRWQLCCNNGAGLDREAGAVGIQLQIFGNRIVRLWQAGRVPSAWIA